MNTKFILISCVFAVLVALVAAGKGDREQKAIDVDRFGSMDVIENDVPNYADKRMETCAKSKTPQSCNECCVKEGFDKGYHPKRLERLVARKLSALGSKCTCVNDAIRQL